MGSNPTVSAKGRQASFLLADFFLKISSFSFMTGGQRHGAVAGSFFVFRSMISSLLPSIETFFTVFPIVKQLLSKSMRDEAMWGAFERLSLKERMMIAQSGGFCVDCYGTLVFTEDKNGNKVPAKRKPMMNTDIAVFHQCTAKTVVYTFV
ncbi:MAG: hypothetical protein IJ766_07065 [Clostridia bacterium]|nr:hypothetical protein [Clostridia bacterium]